MFINCPYCRALVATDPVTDAPPSHCPHCDSLLRRDPAVDAQTEGQDDPPPLDLAVLLAMPTDAPTPGHAPERMPEHAAERNRSETAASEPPRNEPDSVLTDPDLADPAVPAVSPDGALPDNVAPPAAPIARAPVRAPRGLPSFLRGGGGSAPQPRERWVLYVVIALALLLVLQLLLADRARLAADARWRPVLHALCTALRCDLPPWREPAAFTLVQRDVRQHPQLPGTLRVTATFRNDARWAQPWPRLQLRLTDGNGRNAGERSFRAEEYLGGAPSQTELGSGETASVAMDILEPAPGIVGYDFGFR
jgi:hypothetical protein